MKDAPCNVCGSTDLNLVDGFYYCVECGTQDVNVRETVVEQTFLADGTVAFVAGKKFSVIVSDGIEMSGEWYKWHAYNFILYGLTEQLIKLGAKPTIKMKVLWIWSRYMRKFQEKVEEKGEEKVQSKLEDSILNNPKSPESLSGTTSESENDEMGNENKFKTIKNIRIITKGLFLAILYLALNFDKSHIQLYHLLRFIKEGRLSIPKCTKFVPKEINTKLIPNWKSFLLCQSDYKSHTIQEYALTCVKLLNLGHPIVPDFNKIIHSYTKELCLPLDFRNLVSSLIFFRPYDYVKYKISLFKMLRLPDYEIEVMSYVLVALKMCFGLDGDYEVCISDVIDKINDEENHLKSCKLGMYSEPTDRLFSFNQWTRFLQFRKILLCQYYLPMARWHNLDVDDYVLMEHMEERNSRPIKLKDEVTMDILNKIPQQNNINVILKSEFLPSLTPMYTYTEIVLNYVLSDEIRLTLSEDFAQYNLKYATEDLKLLEDKKDGENIIIGVNESNKIIESIIKGDFESIQGDMSMVFIRNCDNKNWLKTKPPTLEHIKQITEEETSDRDSDNGYETSSNDIQVKTDECIKDEEDITFESFEEEQEDVNIFDDNFDLLINDDKSFIEPAADINIDQPIDDAINASECDSDISPAFDINNFDKGKVIDELISIACKKYKIKLPKEYVPRPTRKRKCNDGTEAGECAVKQRRQMARSGEVKLKINNMIGEYYTQVENDILTKVTEKVRQAIERQGYTNNTSESLEGNEIGNDLNHEQIDTVPEMDNAAEMDTIAEMDTVADSSLNPNEINNVDNLNQSDIKEDEDIDDNEKEDPEFDARTHDIGQLYVKLNEGVAIDESVTINDATINDDPQIDEIILNKIEMCRNDKSKLLLDDLSSSDESSDDEAIPQLDKDKNKEYFTPLIKDPSQVNLFNYWIRHYNPKALHLDVHQKFESELNEHFPASFQFVINECANMLGCSSFKLYKSMQKLEKKIFKV